MATSWQRTRLNFLRRYKWAFIPEYEDVDLQPLGHPSFTKFVAACEAMHKASVLCNSERCEFLNRLQDDQYLSQDGIALAREILPCLLMSPNGWAGRWSEERKEVRTCVTET